MTGTYFWRFLYPKVKKVTQNMIIILIIFCLSACSSRPHRAPVSSVSQPASLKISHHTVSRGDTLYSIAWRYNLDYRNLSKINRIGPPYQIQPGQKIRLKGVAKKKAYRAKPTKPSSKLPVKVATTISNSGKVVKPTVSKTPSKRLKNKPIKPTPVKTSPIKTSSLVWSWPVKGSVVGSFKSGKGLNKGIDIAAKLGESVRAAADGEVVYAGSGLRGYGKLLIIKHENSYLSAYAHNRLLVAKEKDRVKRGQKIAEVGGSGTTAVKLHFEIRRDGVPIDPIKVLPR